MCSYDIKLTWTKPSQFDAYGVQIPYGMRAITSDERASFGAAVPVKKNQQRRTIDLMRYGSDYTNTKDVEKEIALLDNPPHEKIEASKPRMLKGFGVFQAKTENKGVTDGTNDDSGVLRGIESASETDDDSIASQIEIDPQKLLVPDDPQLSNPLGSNWPDDLDILGDKAQGLEWFAAELRDDVQLSMIPIPLNR